MKKAFPPLVYKDSKILILGTMPGEVSLQAEQYYANKGNQFWKLLYAVFDTDHELDYEQRKLLLKKNKIAVWDVLASCEREGSLDSNIKNEEVNDFKTFYNKYPGIEYIFFSSKNAEKYYNRYIKKSSDKIYYVLPSPSGANATKTFIQKLEEWKKIKQIILTI